jgi:UDP-2,3-diacylglucosamine hydrolase
MDIRFISDLHLEPNNPDIANCLNALTQTLHQTQGLYILGDLFDAWIGDDDKRPFHTEIIQTLRALSDSGVPVFFMHGNRDFLIGKRFLKAAGATLLPEETVIDLFGTRTLIMHGDTLCTDDLAYMEYRRKIRRRWVRWLFLRKSLKKRRAIADKLRTQSRQYQANVDHAILDVNHAEVVRLMKKHQVTQLIHGHTHRPAIHEFSVDGQACRRIVLAAWHTQGHQLIADEHGALSLVNG